MISTYEDLEDFIARKLRHIRQTESLHESIDAATASETDQLREAAAMLFASSEKSKIYKDIRDACSDFIKSSIPEGEYQVPGFSINHYSRKVFDKAAWEHACQTEEALRELWQGYREYEDTKKQLKDNFQYLDSSIRVTPEAE